jgi:hypothetical protein
MLSDLKIRTNIDDNYDIHSSSPKSKGRFQDSLNHNNSNIINLIDLNSRDKI